MKRYKYRGTFDPDLDYIPGDYCLFEGRGYRLLTEDGWKAMTATADPSDRGPKGEPGIPGRDGVDGRSIVGPVGPRGERGERGQTGKDGKDGKRGPKGYDGGSGMIIKRESTNIVTAIADGVVTIGDVIRVAGAGTVTRAIASGSDADATAVGIVTAVDGTEVKYVTAGPAVVPGPLTPGVVYYLSPDVAGGMTSTFPNTPGNRVVILGAATDVDAINVKIDWALVIAS